MWRRLLLWHTILCLWFLGVIFITVLCGIDLFFIEVYCDEFHNSWSSVAWIFLCSNLGSLNSLVVRHGFVSFYCFLWGSAQLIALVYSTKNNSDWGIIFTCIATCLRMAMVSSFTIDQILHVGANIFNLHRWKNVTILVVGLDSFNVKFVPSFIFFGGWNQWTDRY